MSRTSFNPLDPGYQLNPYPHYELLREEPAVVHDRKEHVRGHRQITAPGLLL